MNILRNSSLAIAGALVLAACAGTELERTTGIQNTGSAFDRALYEGYIERSKHEYNYGGYTSSDAYARKARAAANAESVLPFTPNDNGAYPPGQVPDSEFAAMTQGRADLMRAFEAGARSAAPADAASAQVHYDCWVEEQSYAGDFWEATQPAHAAECRAGFESALARVQQALRPATAQAPEPAATTASSFLMFFDWDRANITESAREVVRAAAQAFQRSGSDRVQVVGHADTSGPSDYNDGLSERRARNAVNALTMEGVPERNVEIEWQGESSPLVSTGDGVREPQNRRVEIRFAN